MEGKRQVHVASLVLSLVAWMLHFVAFASPYWYQSWPRVYSGFKRTGLWETCFAGLIVNRDPSMKSYHGCWWILAPEYWNIRSWIMPWWFVICQVVCLFVFLFQMISLIMQLVIFTRTNRRASDGLDMKTAPLGMTTVVTIMHIVFAVMLVMVCLLFGLEAIYDYAWMPHHELNYLSWSYGLAILATFFEIFASMALVCYLRIIRTEKRHPPGRSTTPYYPGATKA